MERSTSKYRSNRILGKFFVPLLFILALFGIKLCVFQVPTYLIEVKGQFYYGNFYRLQFVFFLTLLTYCFLLIWLPKNHSSPSFDPPMKIQEKQIIYGCDENGEATRCWRGSCNGRWKPLRTKHCEDCERCLLEFDHHCPFLDSCIARDTRVPFLAFLVLVVPLIGIALIPLIPLQVAAIQEVVSRTWYTSYMKEIWWSKWYSWLGGPIWRYSVGLILAYCYYYQDASLQTSLFLAHPSVTSRVSSLQTPQLSTLLIVFSGLALLIFAAVMVFIIVRNALGGVTTYEAYTLGRWKTARRLRKKNDDSNQSTPPTVPNVRLQLYVPVYETIDGLSYIGATVSVDPDRGIYDFGRRENLRNWIASDNLSNLIGLNFNWKEESAERGCYRLKAVDIKMLEEEAKASSFKG